MYSNGCQFLCNVMPCGRPRVSCTAFGGTNRNAKYIEESNCSDRNDRYNQHHLRTPRAPRKQRMGTGQSCGRLIRPFELIPC